MAQQSPIALNGGGARPSANTGGSYGGGQQESRGLMGGTMFGGNYYRPGTRAGDIPDAEETRRRLQQGAAGAGQRGAASMDAANISTVDGLQEARVLGPGAASFLTPRAPPLGPVAEKLCVVRPTGGVGARVPKKTKGPPVAAGRPS